MGGQIKGKQLVTDLHLSGSLTMSGSVYISGSDTLTLVGLQNNPKSLDFGVIPNLLHLQAWHRAGFA